MAEEQTNSAVSSWGRVDADNNVFVTTSEGERQVGQYPDATPEEALNYFVKKFEDLETQVSLEEVRVARGSLTKNAKQLLQKLKESVTEANAVGDLNSLRTRIEQLEPKVAELLEAKKAESESAVAEAVAQREQIILKIEALVAQSENKIQWKSVTKQVEDIFTEWKTQQANGPRLPKTTADELWKRFRKARNTLDAGRRQFFAKLDENHKTAKAAKQDLIAQAKELNPEDSGAPAKFRNLMQLWKKTGRAGQKVDDNLWQQFNAVGDEIFKIKADQDAQFKTANNEIISAKEALLVEGEKLLSREDSEEARAALNNLQSKWDEQGRLPRDLARPLDARLAKIEAHFKNLEAAKWKREDPEKIARTNDVTDQLVQSIQQLEADIAEAKTAGNKKKTKELEEALAARQLWLTAVQGNS